MAESRALVRNLNSVARAVQACFGCDNATVDGATQFNRDPLSPPLHRIELARERCEVADKLVTSKFMPAMLRLGG